MGIFGRSQPSEAARARQAEEEQKKREQAKIRQAKERQERQERQERAERREREGVSAQPVQPVSSGQIERADDHAMAQGSGAEPAKKNLTKQQRRDGNIGCIILIALVVLAFIGLRACTSEDRAKTDEEVAARVQCDDAVKAQLKTPSTADVHRGNLSREANNTIIITGTVDSDNSFGARLTLDYRCATVNGSTEARVSE